MQSMGFMLLLLLCKEQRCLYMFRLNYLYRFNKLTHSNYSTVLIRYTVLDLKIIKSFTVSCY